MLVVLDALSPLERLAFVLHDVFGLSFDDIAPIVERTPTAARQLASRARRRVRGVDLPAERMRQREAVGAFLRAARDGDFGTLLQLLDPEVELRTDAGAVAIAAPHAEQGAPLLRRHARGADAVARVFAGRAEQTEIALVDGFPGAAYAPGGVPQAVYAVHLQGGRIVRIDVIGDAAHIAELAIGLDPPV
jgi:RNA polymerase sigma-70 factor (ECF subfamily)